MTPLLLPVWWYASRFSASSTTTEARVCCESAIAVANPTMPPPMMATSNRVFFIAVNYSCHYLGDNNNLNYKNYTRGAILLHGKYHIYWGSIQSGRERLIFSRIRPSSLYPAHRWINGHSVG